MVFDLERMPFPGIQLQKITPLWYLLCVGVDPLVFGRRGTPRPVFCF